MIKPEQIPDEVVEAMLESIGSFFCRAEARAALSGDKQGLTRSQQ